MPLRPVTPKAADSATQKKAQQGGGMGGGGGGRGGGRGGRGGRGGGGGGMGGMDEKPGSTRILKIVPEGSRVKKGDVVAELDGAAYVDEAGRPRRSAISRPSRTSNRPTRSSRSTRSRSANIATAFIRRTSSSFASTSRPASSKKTDSSATSPGPGICSRKASERLTRSRATDLRSNRRPSRSARPTACSSGSSKQTGPKLVKELEANVRAIQSDKLTQDASFSLEQQRLNRIIKNIEHCTVRAPSDGIVVYVNQTSPWGQVIAPIDEGVTLRQDQPIFSLPDPKHMRVKARINESKVTMVHTGQRVLIAVDAFPERQLHGTVREVTQISTPLNASDVRVYYANIDIDEGFDDLRPGFSAEVILNIESRPGVTRVPLKSVRWIGQKAYVALYDRASAETGSKRTWRWRPIELGLSDTEFAEVTSGLQVGDRVVATPRALPAPTPATTDKPSVSVARES